MISELIRDNSLSLYSSPAVRKSIQGKSKSVLRNLGPDYTIDQAIEVLTREYEGVANSDVVIKEFYQLKQEKNE